MKNLTYFSSLLLFVFFSCSSPQALTSSDDGIFELTIVQVNDVYEIAPVSNGKAGGVARIATLKDRELAKNKNTILVMAGDFLSPSVFNSLEHNNQRIRGAQMIAALNSAGLDYAGIGNHEFDINEREFQARLNESEFTWISSNTFYHHDQTFQSFYQEKPDGSKQYIPEEVILELKDEDGTQVKIGIFSLLLPFNKADYVTYKDMFQAAHDKYNVLSKECDAVIALTHISMEDDIELARQLPNLAMIIGGHEHDGRFAKIGDVAITKAEANARTAYVNKIMIDKNNATHSATQELIHLDESFELQSKTQAVVDEWMNIAAQSYASAGFDAFKVIKTDGETYDILESSIREHPTNFSRLVVKAMESAAPKVQAAIINSGSMRLDDMLSPPITEYDILRAMPYGGKIVETDITGELLVQVLEAGMSNITEGGFLQFSEQITNKDNTWFLNGNAIETNEIYRIGFADFLISGLEANLDFLNPNNPLVKKVYPDENNAQHPKNDLRRAVISYLLND